MFYPVDDTLWRKSSAILHRGLIYNLHLRKDASLTAEVGSLTRKNVFYTVDIEPDQTYICGCRGNLASDNVCSHIVAVLRWLEENEGIIYNIFDRRFRRGYRVGFMKTSLENVNDIMGIEKPFPIDGGLPVGLVLGLIADAEVGKSIMCIQFMFETMKNRECNAVIINTEPGSGMGDVYMEYWGQVFSNRFDFEMPQIRRLRYKEKKRKKDDRTRIKFKYRKYDGSKPVIFVANYSSSDQILDILGRRIKLEIGTTGKITPVYDTDELLPVEKTAFGNFIEEHNIGFLAFDSITEPINEFIGGLKNYPGRHEATNVWMKMFRDYADYYELVAIGTHHETVKGFGQAGAQSKKIKGGKSVRHAFKFNILIEGMNKTKGRPVGIKRIGVERHPFKPPLSDLRFLRLSEIGYEDLIGDPQYNKALQAEMVASGIMEAPKKKKTPDDESSDNWRDNK